MPSTTKLFFKDPLTDDGVHLQLFRLQGDWWLMDADGSHQRRLTHFNLPGYPEGSGPLLLPAWLTGRPMVCSCLGRSVFSKTERRDHAHELGRFGHWQVTVASGLFSSLVFMSNLLDYLAGLPQ